MEVLAKALEAWDAKNTNKLQALYQEYLDHPNFLQILTDWSIRDLARQDASTWMLKHYLEDNQPYTRADIVSLLPALAVAKGWPAQLHLLQILPKVELRKEDFEILLPPIEQLIQSPNKFVKAWAYYDLGLASHYLPELKQEVADQFEIAFSIESAAIKARIRRAIKDFKL